MGSGTCHVLDDSFLKSALRLFYHVYFCILYHLLVVFLLFFFKDIPVLITVFILYT